MNVLSAILLQERARLIISETQNYECLISNEGRNYECLISIDQSTIGW
jgi:hypothetical protein